MRLRDMLDMAVAQGELVRARWRLRHVEAGRLVASGGHARPGNADDAPAQVAEVEITRAERWARAVGRAARWGPVDAACLARSVALHRMLCARGIAGSRVRFGVRTGPGGFEAHAWVTLGTRVLGDDPAFVARFRELPDVTLSESP